MRGVNYYNALNFLKQPRMLGLSRISRIKERICRQLGDKNKHSALFPSTAQHEKERSEQMKGMAESFDYSVWLMSSLGVRNGKGNICLIKSLFLLFNAKENLCYASHDKITFSLSFEQHLAITRSYCKRQSL